VEEKKRSSFIVNLRESVVVVSSRWSWKKRRGSSLIVNLREYVVVGRGTKEEDPEDDW
jgi:hypothetical protein